MKVFWHDTFLVIQVAFSMAIVQEVWWKVIGPGPWFVPFVLSFMFVRSVVSMIEEMIEESCARANVPPPTPLVSVLSDISGLPPQVEDIAGLDLEAARAEVLARLEKTDDDDPLRGVYTALCNRIVSELERRKSAPSGTA